MQPSISQDPTVAQTSPTLVMNIAPDGVMKEFRFQTSFRIGRSDECEVSIKDQYISRIHASVWCDAGQWWIQDLNSSNGIFLDGQKAAKVAINDGTRLRFGIHGLEASFTVLQPVQPTPAPQTKNPDRYFGKLAEGETVGEHTMFIRSAFAQVQKKQKRNYSSIIGLLILCALGLAAFGLHQYQKANRQRQIAEQMFYSIKSLDLDIANLQESVSASNNQQAKVQLQSIEGRRAQMEESYNRFLASMHIYDPNMSEQDRLIVRMARIFGECEVDMPKDFRSEVARYIKYWQSSQRLAMAIKTANANGYTPVIAREMVRKELPPQYFYLAMEESDFNPLVSGPATGSGIAKGMWQFIPPTAAKYGLHLGPMVDDPAPDTMDDRDHFDRETVAASKYIKDLYGSDAEASGLLVMACYNWGQPQVLRLVRSMPNNPTDRNFWQLLQKHRQQIPQETYDYVFRIFAAAVIGENPHLFGFNFDNPLANAASNLQTTEVVRPVVHHHQHTPRPA